MLRKLIIGFLLIITSPLMGLEFPLCVYGISDLKWVPEVKKAGFTCFQSYQKDPDTLSALAKQASKYGLKTVFLPDQVIGSAKENEAKSWPMLAWYLVDEPDVHKWSRERVRQAHQRSKTAFPNQLTTLVIGQGRTLIPYYDLPDVMMVDWYPVPHLALTSFGDNVRYTLEGMERHNSPYPRKLWGVVQIFDWKDYKQHRPDNDRIGRFPTEEEIRFMSYDGILNGATGLFYFIFTAQNKPMFSFQPDNWKRVTRVIKELEELLPILENGIIVENPLAISRPLVMQSRAYKGYIYMILLNASDQPQQIPPALLEKYYQKMFEKKKEKTIPPYGVWILKYS